jgi:hypothetical protein
MLAASISYVTLTGHTNNDDPPQVRHASRYAMPFRLTRAQQQAMAVIRFVLASVGSLPI